MLVSGSAGFMSLPAPLLFRMIKASKDMFNEVLKLGMEENYDIRVMAVGQAGVGKSTLARRLLKLPVDIKDYNITNGIEVHIQSCQVDLDTGKWGMITFNI